MSILEALERAFRGTMYAEAYEEAVRTFLMQRGWLNYKPLPGDKITIRRPTRQTESP